MATLPGTVRVELVKRAGGVVARVTVDNERKLNTLSSALMVRFVEEIEKLGSLEALRALVLRGAGRRAPGTDPGTGHRPRKVGRRGLWGEDQTPRRRVGQGAQLPLKRLIGMV